MTTKERAIQVIEALPENASLQEIVVHLQRMKEVTNADVRGAAGGAWDLLQRAAGSLEMPADWSSEHDHYLYGTPKRSSGE